MLNNDQILFVFEKRLAYLKGLHVVYASQKHGEEYLNKDALLAYVTEVSMLCKELAERIQHLKIQVLVAPVVGAVTLAHWTAHHLQLLTGDEVLAVYADKVGEEATLRSERDALVLLAERVISTRDHAVEHLAAITELETLIASIKARGKYEESFELKRGYDAHVRGKRCFPIEDVINSGGSIAKVIRVTRDNGGIVVGAGGLANRGGVTADALGIPELIALLNVQMGAWNLDELPQHIKDRPIATHVGHGKKFLEQQKSQSTH